MCFDYKALNINKIINAYPIPYFDDVYMHLGTQSSLTKLNQPKATIKFRQPRVMGIKLYFRCTLDSLSIVFFYLSYIIYQKHSKDSCIRYFEPIQISFALCIWMMFLSSHGLLPYIKSTSTGFNSNQKSLDCMPK